MTHESAQRDHGGRKGLAISAVAAPVFGSGAFPESLPGEDAGVVPGPRPRRERSGLVGWALWLAPLLLVLVISFIPGKYLPEKQPHQSDKLVHLLAFAWLGLQGGLFARERRTAWIAALASFLIGALIEVIQPCVGRGFSSLDMATNGVGILAGTLLGRSLAGRR